MPFRKIEPERLSRSVVRQIESLILQGILRPGERLPGERELAERMDVSRPSLREAIAELQAEGLLVSRPGSGVFVAEVLGSAFSPALIRLFANHDEALFDYISFRRDIEALAAERAATQATDTDLAVIGAIFARMEAAHSKPDPEAEARLDAEFHLAILEASHNVIMLHMMRSMFDLLRAGVFYNRQVLFRQTATRDALLDQHRMILDALRTRNPAAARRAVGMHLGFVEDVLKARRRSEEQESVARQRLEQERRRE